MNIHPHVKNVLFTEEQIKNKCKDLAQWIDQEYKDSEGLILVGLLNGSVPFLAELIKHINIKFEYHFIKAKSYHGTEMKSNGKLKVYSDIHFDLNNKDLLIVDEIIDTGLTLYEIVEWFKNKNVKTVKSIALIDKVEGRLNDYQADKVGYKIDNVFVVGFGLDLNEQLRGLPYVGEFNTDFINEYK